MRPVAQGMDWRPAMRTFTNGHDVAHIVRFWVSVDGRSVCAMVSDTSLRCCFVPPQPRRAALSIFGEHLAELDAMVRRRMAAGSAEPVMLHDSDFPIDAADALDPKVSRWASRRP